MSFSLSAFSVVGFSGRRFCSASVAGLVGRVVRGLPSSVSVAAGCALGVDAAARSACSASGSAPSRSCRVFSAASFAGSFRGRLVARSCAFVRFLASAGGCLVVFPGRVCPARVVPGSSWVSGGGSGSWASAALAVGLGVPVVVWLPGGVSAPSWLRPLAGFSGWWVA